MNRIVKSVAIGVSFGLVAQTKADTTVTVDPSQNWIGYMNWSEVPANGGAYVLGDKWGFNDLSAVFTTGMLTITPNTSIDRGLPTSTYWWQDASGTSAGNKIMDANAYVQSDALAGQTIDFVGTVSANTLVSPYTSIIFIKDFAGDYSSSTSVTAPVTAGAFALTLPTAPGTHVQYGFETIGPDARLAAIASLGSVIVATSSGVTSTVISAWASTTGGDYNTASNWTNGVPNSIDSEADFGSALTTSGTVNTATAITLGTLNFNNANTYTLTGTGLTMQTSTGSASIIVQQGTQNIGLPLSLASNTNLNVSSGANLIISSPVTAAAGTTATLTGPGTVSFTASSNLSGFTLSAGANANISSTTSTRALLQTTSLSVDPTATLNLTNSDLIVHSGMLATVTASIASGYNNGQWNGAGIDSSAAASNTKRLTALGVISNNSEAGTPLYGSGGSLGNFDGTSPALNDVLVRYTYYGDANLDGKVDGSDYSMIDNGKLMGLSGWQNGDFNYDGVINGSDYSLIDNAFNTQGGQIAAGALQAAATAQIAGTSAVPEPVSLALFAMGSMTLLGRRRRQ